MVREAWAAGQRDFGENYVQEAIAKIEALADLRARSGITSARLQSQQGARGGRALRLGARRRPREDRRRCSRATARPGRAPLQVCVQVNISAEATKGGVQPGEALALARHVASLPGLRFRGLMGMASPSGDEAKLRAEFALLRRRIGGDPRRRARGRHAFHGHDARFPGRARRRRHDAAHRHGHLRRARGAPGARRGTEAPSEGHVRRGRQHGRRHRRRPGRAGLCRRGHHGDRAGRGCPRGPRGRASASRYARRPGADLPAADALVLAVKPQQMREAVQPLLPLAPATLVVTIAAGIRIADLSRWLGGHAAIVRAMPNTPALVHAGVTGLYAPPAVGEEGRRRARRPARRRRGDGLAARARGTSTRSPPSPAAGRPTSSISSRRWSGPAASWVSRRRPPASWHWARSPAPPGLPLERGEDPGGAARAGHLQGAAPPSARSRRWRRRPSWRTSSMP